MLPNRPRLGVAGDDTADAAAEAASAATVPAGAAEAVPLLPPPLPPPAPAPLPPLAAGLTAWVADACCCPDWLVVALLLVTVCMPKREKELAEGAGGGWGLLLLK